jgi:hypothetical protein
MNKIHTLLMNQNESRFRFSLSAQPVLYEGINLIDLFLPLGRMGLIDSRFDVFPQICLIEPGVPLRQ